MIINFYEINFFISPKKTHMVLIYFNLMRLLNNNKYIFNNNKNL